MDKFGRIKKKEDMSTPQIVRSINYEREDRKRERQKR
jgi:hypothetical protein